MLSQLNWITFASRLDALHEPIRLFRCGPTAPTPPWCLFLHAHAFPYPFLARTGTRSGLKMRTVSSHATQWCHVWGAVNNLISMRHPLRSTHAATAAARQRVRFLSFFFCLSETCTGWTFVFCAKQPESGAFEVHVWLVNLSSFQSAECCYALMLAGTHRFIAIWVVVCGVGCSRYQIVCTARCGLI